MADATSERRRAPEAEPASAGFKTQDWDGHEHYQCSDCAYDNFDQGLMLTHQNIVHGRII